MDPSDNPIRRRRKDARPQELLDAALELFVEKGFAATRAEEVAIRAGVSKGTLYLYYPSKEDLLKAAIAQNLSERLAAGAAEAATFPGTPGELLRHILVRWWTQVYDSPASAVFKLVVTEVRNFPEIGDYYIHEVVEPAHALLGGIIQRGIDSGEFRPVDVGVAVHSLVLPMIMVCLHKHSLGACAVEEHHIDGRDFIRQHVDLVLSGLCRHATVEAPALTCNESGPGSGAPAAARRAKAAK
ncbi:TetR/AcrR family transcriptional regulator [Aquincola sp. S2]|uniref:TetR/AcrR family transcriptional regulator n=1 Tax=Pseudaquabacterium terrae TaxID=2732868 RepID=A0ABX2EEU4_9BURK|nr:TetR/AcrR family transcriptional regulator [Aquabacterium terrae]NRF67145.1 TetR/AcrR family transcriptional regulator [Aquabacterium terrae]